MRIPVHPDHARNVRADPEKLETLVACARSFREFLDHWTFIDQETGEERILGRELWSGQEQFVEAMEVAPMVYALKARKLGFTTLAIAFDAWVLRFRDKNARVHLFSRRADAAAELLDAVKYGLNRLPTWMQLKVKRSRGDLLELFAEEDDLRTCKAYPADEDTAVEATCTHAHIDEWARMGNPQRVWQAIHPTLAKSAHIITTGLGPVNYSSEFWRKTLAGDTEFIPIFLPALERPDRDVAWLEQKKRSMSDQARRQEFPETWEDALSSGGRFTFKSSDIDAAGIGRGPRAPEDDHRYVKAWDIGRHQDAAVGTVLDVTMEPTEVVHYVRLRGVPYPSLQEMIERVHKQYTHGPTVIESNSMGEAVAENLDPVKVKERDLILFHTGKKSKARILEELMVALESRSLRWSSTAWPQLDAEVRGYQIPDDTIVQDSVMSLAIANFHVDAPYSAGRVGKIVRW